MGGMAAPALIILGLIAAVFAFGFSGVMTNIITAFGKAMGL